MNGLAKLRQNGFPQSLSVTVASCIWLCLLASLSSCMRASDPVHSTELAVQGLYNATLSDNAEFALIGSINHGASLWSVANKERLFNWNHKKGEFSQITEVGISPANDFALTASPLTMVLWDRVSGQGFNYWNAPSEILGVDLLPGGIYAALALVDHTATLFDVANGGVQRIYNHDGRVNSVDTHLGRNLLLSGSDDFSAKLWNLNTGEQIFRWDMDEEVQLVKLSPDGSLAFAMAKYAQAATWNTATGEKTGEIPLGSSAIRRGKMLTAVSFSNDGQWLLTGTADRVIQLWQTSDMREIKRWETPRRNKASPTAAAVLALAFESNSRFYAITSDGLQHLLTL